MSLSQRALLRSLQQRDRLCRFWSKLNLSKRSSFLLLASLCSLAFLISTSSSSSFSPFSAPSPPPSHLFNENDAAVNATNLIMVACHSILSPKTPLTSPPLSDRNWFLLPYQRHQGLPEAIDAHIHAGLTAAAADPQSLLLVRPPLPPPRPPAPLLPPPRSSAAGRADEKPAR